jgi:ATP-binding cassette subfamily F protein 3
VQSRIKKVQKIEIIEEICEDPQSVFIFPQITDTLKAPLLLLDEANIGYNPKNPIIKEANISIDLESRIAVVGPNGAGKTTLLKALIGELAPIDGMFYRHNRLRVAFFTQMHVEQLDLKLSALEQMQEQYPEVPKETIRNHLGSFGLSGHLALRPMYLLSGGQKSRVVFAMITYSSPHIILMDEPTNHLDIDAINALSIALSTYNGGLVIVSHDQYFISSLCQRIFIVKNQKLKEFKGDFTEYRSTLKVPQ